MLMWSPPSLADHEPPKVSENPLTTGWHAPKERTRIHECRSRGAPEAVTLRNTHMSRRCELTGKGVMVGNNVSHANNKTKRRFLPNLNEVSLASDALGRTFKFRISSAALRTVDHRGGLDAFMAKAKDADLSAKALKVKKDIEKAQAAA